MKTVEELKQMKYDITRKMGDYLECLTEWTSHIEEHEREDCDLYQKGLDDAWEMARKIVISPFDGGMNIDDLVQCFGELSYSRLFRSPASEAKAKYDAWKEKKEQEEQIHVGDVVETVYGNYVILRDSGNGFFLGMELQNNELNNLHKNNFKKTGKHYDLPWLTEQEQEEHDA